MLRPIFSLLALVLLLAGCEELMQELGEAPPDDSSSQSDNDDNGGGYY